MSNSSERETIVELSTTRVSGGPSPRIFALAVAIALVGVVYLGLSGRPGDPAASRSPQPTQATPIVAAAGPTALPARSTRVEELVPGDSGQRPNPYLGTSLRVGSDHSLAVLRELSPGYLYAAYRIPFPRPARQATLEVAKIGADNESFERFGRWSISLDPLAPETRLAGTVLDTAHAPVRAAIADTEAPTLLRNGYRIRVRVESRLSFGVLVVEIREGRAPWVPDEGYRIATTLGRRHFTASFRPTQDFGNLVATIVLPDSIALRELPFRLRAMPASASPGGQITVGSWLVLLPPPREFGANATLLDETVPAGPVGPGQAQITGNGFRLVARSNAAKGDRFVEFELTIAPTIDPLLPQSLSELPHA